MDSPGVMLYSGGRYGCNPRRFYEYNANCHQDIRQLDGTKCFVPDDLCGGKMIVISYITYNYFQFDTSIGR